MRESDSSRGHSYDSADFLVDTPVRVAGFRFGDTCTVPEPERACDSSVAYAGVCEPGPTYTYGARAVIGLFFFRNRRATSDALLPQQLCTTLYDQRSTMHGSWCRVMNS